MHYKLQSQLVQTKEALVFGELGQEGTDGVAVNTNQLRKGSYARDCVRFSSGRPPLPARPGSAVLQVEPAYALERQCKGNKSFLGQEFVLQFEFTSP